MPRAYVEVDRATMGPERLAAKIGAYARLHAYVPAPPGGAGQPSARSRHRRNGDGTTPSSPECRSSWRAPAPPGSTPASAPCTPPPGTWRPPASGATSPSSPRPWSTCSGTDRPQPYGGPSTTPTRESAGAARSIRRRSSRRAQWALRGPDHGHHDRWNPPGRGVGQPGRAGLPRDVPARPRLLLLAVLVFYQLSAPPGLITRSGPPGMTLRICHFTFGAGG